MSDNLSPEIGDLVDYGVAIRNPDGSVKVPAPRGIIDTVFANGNIIVKPHSGAPKQKLFPGEYCVLSKAYQP